MGNFPRMDGWGNQFFERESKRIKFMATGLMAVAGRNVPICGTNKRHVYGIAHGEIQAGYIELNIRNLVDPRKPNSVIQKKVTETLAHEVRHLFQPDRRGKVLRFIYDVGIWEHSPNVLTLAVILGLFLWLVSTILGLWNIENLFLFRSILCNTALFACVVAALLVSAGWIYYFFIDAREKDARAFAKEAVKQKKWLDIVQVEDI